MRGHGGAQLDSRGESHTPTDHPARLAVDVLYSVSTEARYENIVEALEGRYGDLTLAAATVPS
jgi:hypothetical protein